MFNKAGKVKEDELNNGLICGRNFNLYNYSDKLF
jgi:hypothetical protein